MGWAEAPTVTPGGGWQDAPQTEEQRMQSQMVDNFGTSNTGADQAFTPEQIAKEKSQAETMFQGVHNAAFMGFGDSVNGAMGALVGANPLNPGEYFGGMGDRYAQGRDEYRDQYAQNEAQNPGSMMAGNIAGSLIPAAVSLPYATGKSVLGTALRGAGIGGVEGGIAGAGYADGQNVAASAGRGAVIGAFAGAAVPMGVAALRIGGDGLTGGFDAMFNRANMGKASRAVGGAVRSSGKSQADIADALARAVTDGQPEYRLMDAIGKAGQRQASGVARGGGDAGTEIADFLANRQAGQGERVGGFVDDAFATKGTTAAKTTEALTKARGDTANIAYDAARGNAAPVNLNDTIATIDNLTKRDPILGESALADTVIGKRLKALRAQMATGDQQLIDFDSVLNIKQDMFATMEGLRKSGKTVPKELSDVYGALDGALEGASDMYRTANDGFRSASKVIGAVDDGAMMANRGRAADNVPAFQAMNADMQGAARVGYGDSLLSALERNPSPTANKAKPLIQSQKRAAEAEAMALNPQQYADRLGRENDMWETQNRALGGSLTADNQQDIASVAGGAIGAVKSVASMNIGDAVTKIAGLLAPIAKTQNPATRQLIAKALMSGDASALVPMVKREMRGQGASRIVEALLRNGLQLGGGVR